MLNNVVKFPTIKSCEYIREEILGTLEEHKDIDVGILLIQEGEDISIFTSRYSVELVGALEVLKTKIMVSLLELDEE